MAITNSQIDLAWFDLCRVNAWSGLLQEKQTAQWLYFLWLASQDATKPREWNCFFETLWQTALETLNLEARTSYSSKTPIFY